jgi:hypothetical protein
VPIPGFDTTSIDTSVDPVQRLLQVCLREVRGEPSDSCRPDRGGSVLRALQREYAGAEWNFERKSGGWGGTVVDEQKIGDYYKACMDTDLIDQAKGLEPIEPLLKEIDAVTGAREAQLAGADWQAAADGCQRVLRLWGTAGLQGREQADCDGGPRRPWASGEGLLPARAPRTSRCASSMLRTWRRC